MLSLLLIFTLLAMLTLLTRLILFICLYSVLLETFWTSMGYEVPQIYKYFCHNWSSYLKNV